MKKKIRGKRRRGKKGKEKQNDSRRLRSDNFVAIKKDIKELI